ncbi:MAG: L,D-transpeptidase family protein [Pseudomonadota bacterium]
MRPLAALLLLVPFTALSLRAAPVAAQEDGAPALPAGCVATIAALPASPLFAPDDPRLRGGSLIVVLKEARVAMVFAQGALRQGGDGPACWRVALGVNDRGEYPPGPKRRRGDRRTPEGWYRTSDKPSSSFAPAVALHYPNAADARAGLAAGLVTEAEVAGIEQALKAGRKPSQNTRLGGEILFHGGGSWRDWTWGCIALDDADNAEFRAQLPTGMRTDALVLP